MKAHCLILLLIALSQAQIRPGVSLDAINTNIPRINTNINTNPPSINPSATSASFNNYFRDYGSRFNLQNDNYRAMIFQTNFKAIQEHNADQTFTYKLGVNQFTALTQD